MNSRSIALITGASRGIGRALAEELARRGHVVYGAARSWPDGEPRDFTALPLDVTDPIAVQAAIDRVLAEQGRLDLIVANAGVSHAGSVEETTLDVARAMFETNYFGALNLIRAALPPMRAAGHGDLVIVASAAGRIGIPFQAHYVAAKFALEGLAESLHHELTPLGLRVLIIEPGDVATSIWRDNQRAIPPDSPYAPALARFLAVKDREMGAAAADPALIARSIAAIIASPTTRLRHPVPRMARLILLARQLLPDSIFLRLVGRNYRVAG
jgi:NAD(P)-dependent dehydrogenase (short-subunit alcohol dehydrogenase family)